MKYTFISLSALLILMSCHATHSSNTTANLYKITNRIHLDGDGFWDYLAVEESAQRLFVSHGTQVQVVDLETGKISGTISDTKGVHGIAIAPELNKGFISCGRDTSVVVFNLSTLAITAKTKVTGANPDAILYDPFTKRVFTFNHNGNNATVIDAQTNTVIETIMLDGAPEFAVTDNKGHIFVNIEDKNAITAIDSKNLKVQHTWSIAPGEEPTGLAFDINNSRLFAVCSNQKMIVVNSVTGTIIQTLPIGEGTDGVAFDPIKQRIYSADGAGTMTVISEKTPDLYTVLATVPTQKGARTIVLNPITHHLYLPTADREASLGNARPAVKTGTFVVLEIDGSN